jgi:2-keto-4-pentenoate hydratase/2-oxohepta-3-ene-1,7-dioic acid hydratase in catechol pathway
MKLARFEISSPLGTIVRNGLVLSDDKIIDLKSAYARYLDQETRETKPKEIAEVRITDTMNGLINGGILTMEAIKQVEEYFSKLDLDEQMAGITGETIIYDLNKVKLTNPIQTSYLVDFLTFETHYDQGLNRLTEKSLWKKHPVGYKKNPGSLIGPFDDVVIPKSITKWLDYEVEFAIIVGKEGKDIPEDQAGDYIFGYTILNDFSARDMEIPEILLRLGPFKSKDFDTAGPMGPYIVTADEFNGKHPELDMELRHNGVVEQKGNTREMHWTVFQLVSYTSKDQTLVPGTILCSGNPGKVDAGIKKSKRLKAGDVVETEIEKIGTMINKITTKE